MKIILASNSPRRREALSIAGYKFEIIPGNIDEETAQGLPPDVMTLELAKRKALYIKDFIENHYASGKPTLIIGADTTVYINGVCLGKPKNEKDATRMLTLLQGQAHEVYTGVCIIGAFSDFETKTFVEKTIVNMRALTPKEISAYIATGEPFDKAGAYGIQEKGALLIERICGDYFNVAGLPLCKLNLILREYL